jgi:peptide methionine sulfoxide reductase MsrB
MDEKKMDPPIKGQYYMHESTGVYECRNCGSSLFSSVHKFYSGSGYPSFEKAIKKGVRCGDSMDRGVAVHCGKCDLFLGRMIRDEGFTDTQHRFDINSSALRFRSDDVS